MDADKRRETTAYGLMMTWSVNPSRYGAYVLRGYIGHDERLACQLRSRPCSEGDVERLVIARLRQIAAESINPDR